MNVDQRKFDPRVDLRETLDGPAQHMRPPAEVPGYDMRRFLGTGAYGSVWVALNRNTGRKVAIKFLAFRSAVDWSLLSREVEKLVFLSADRYVVQLLEVGWEADPPYFVMEYVENGSLDDLLRRDGPLPVSQAVDIFREVAIGLSRAHSKGVLHCDLKPANVLLDQDHKPRLADFGQSRLVSEQSPALGTLFFNAPEQADLKAVPDARWDIYALGALFFCLLTGNPPYRTDEAVSEIDSGANLTDRLRRYREYLRRVPPAIAHRQVPGMDRALAEIVNRCIAVKANDRFPHVPAVLEALRQRDYARVRRPLLLLGFVAPLLLLLTMSVFGYRAYKRAVNESKAAVAQRTMEGNRFAANGVAKNVAHAIEDRFRAVTDAATDPELHRLVRQIYEDPKSAQQLQRLGDLAEDPTPQDAVWNAFLSSELRQPIQRYMENNLQDAWERETASWFVTNPEGTFLAAAFHTDPKESPIGKNFAYRTYYHGGPKDLKVGQRSERHITEPHLSAVFLSTSTKTWKVAISAPMMDGDAFLGIVALTVELGGLIDFQDSTDRFAVVVDGRPGELEGVILQHPGYEKLKLPDPSDGSDFSDFFKPYVVDVDQLRDAEQTIYQDPLGNSPYGDAFQGDWLAGTAPVEMARVITKNEIEVVDTGLLAIVQERSAAATEPVGGLARRLVRDAIRALFVLGTLSLGLWYLVARSLRESKRASRSEASRATRGSTLHSRETMEQPPEAVERSP